MNRDTGVAHHHGIDRFEVSQIAGQLLEHEADPARERTRGHDGLEAGQIISGAAVRFLQRGQSRVAGSCGAKLCAGDDGHASWVSPSLWVANS